MQPEEPFSFSDRYGLASTRGWIAPAIVIGVIGISWLTWAGLHHSRPEFRATLISFSATSERDISIRYLLTRRDGANGAICTLIARDIDKNIVGQIDDHFDPGTALSIERTTPIPTRLKAVSADISRCRTAA